MKLIEMAILAYAFTCAGLAVYWSIKVSNQPARIPCQVAEISPDFSQQDREKCRIMRGHKL